MTGIGGALVQVKTTSSRYVGETRDASALRVGANLIKATVNVGTATGNADLISAHLSGGAV